MAKIAKFALVAIAAAFSVGAANGKTLLGQAPDPALIVSAGGFEWVYASPCAGQAPSCSSVQLSNGFNFASDAQWNASFITLDVLKAAFLFPSGSVRCASTYFDTKYDHCDWINVEGGYIWHSPLAISADSRNSAFGETFLVRSAAVPETVVPEPATLALLGLGLFGFGLARRNKKA